MNQIGFVEISKVKNERLFRVLLPIGIPWSEAQEALTELSQDIATYVEEMNEQARLQKEKDDKDSLLESPTLEAELAS